MTDHGLYFNKYLCIPQDSQEEDLDLTEEDPRVLFIHNYLQMALKIKPDKWRKLWNHKESQKEIRSFIENPNSKILVFAAPVTKMPFYHIPLMPN